MLTPVREIRPLESLGTDEEGGLSGGGDRNWLHGAPFSPSILLDFAMNQGFGLQTRDRGMRLSEGSSELDV